MSSETMVFATFAFIVLGYSYTLYEHGVSEPPLGSCTHNKTLHMIRHAEGHHNADEISAEKERLYLRDREHTALRQQYGIPWVLLERVSGRRYHDPLLTMRGREQARTLRAQLQDERSFSVEAVAFSPMRRTISTALLGLPQLEALSTTFAINPRSYNSSQSIPPRLVATDLLRERVGPFMCDSRLTRSELEHEYGSLGMNASIDFSDVSETDEAFASGQERHEPEVGSPKLASRAAEALEWLAMLPETSIAVVAHKHILGALFSQHAPSVSQRPFENAEKRTLLLCAQTPLRGSAKLDHGTTHHELHARMDDVVRPVQARVQPLGGQLQPDR